MITEATQEEVEQIIDTMLAQMKEVLIIKAREYSSNNNRFHNFNRIAERQKITPFQALRILREKHIVSTEDIINSFYEKTYYHDGFLKEKWGDTLNYTMLEYAMVMVYNARLKQVDD